MDNVHPIPYYAAELVAEAERKLARPYATQTLVSRREIELLRDALLQDNEPALRKARERNKARRS